MIRHIFFCLIVGSVLTACSSNSRPNGPGGSSANFNAEMPTAPEGAEITIYCQAFSGPDHVAESQTARQALMTGSALKNWYVVHSADHSVLYYGFYATTDQAKTDLLAIKTLMDSQGFRPFQNAMSEPIDSPDPQANPAWDLSRSGGWYSLEIAVFKDNPMRKEAAVDAVREFRKEGVEAYYFHDQNSSVVCIGSWPKEAARENQPDQQNDNPDTPLLVTDAPLPEQAAAKLDQRGWKAVAPQFEPLDPTMIQAKQNYPEFAVNGMTPTLRRTDPATGKDVLVPAPSFFVRVPHDESTEINTASQQPSQQPTPMVVPQPAAKPGIGDLKSIPD